MLQQRRSDDDDVSIGAQLLRDRQEAKAEATEGKIGTLSRNAPLFCLRDTETPGQKRGRFAETVAGFVGFLTETKTRRIAVTKAGANILL
jgi:hypothetical protein